MPTSISTSSSFFPLLGIVLPIAFAEKKAIHLHALSSRKSK